MESLKFKIEVVNTQKKRIFSLTDSAAAKAMEDSLFRAALVKDANEAIKNEFNEEVQLKISFHEFSDDKLVFVLPTKAKEGELSDDALSDVSGGVLGVAIVSDGAFSEMAYACFPDYRSQLQLRGITGDISIK